MTLVTDSMISRESRLDQLLETALDLEGEARAQFLASDAVAADLRDELAELLGTTDEANPLDRGPGGLHSAVADLFGLEASPSSTVAGQRIGRYRLLRLLGEGGSATVWLAARFEDSFSHNVAVKCMKTGLASHESRARFLQEQQILARLQHPQIARLYDAGISTEGVPFIVMEWVDGLSLTRYCDQHRLGIVPRLRLFRKTCAAVAFAHQNLIVHRDLKPANILVGADGEPKLLDFGIAKLLDDSSEPMTRSGFSMLTPDYAAPEQFSGALVTTATDVYALGIVLYELLCGLRPRHIGSPREQSGAAVVTAPSEALRRLSGASASGQADATLQSTQIAHARTSTPDRLRDGLRGDLDTIVLKASQHEPDRRYPTIEALNDDIERYLQQRPIRAQPDSLRYRTQKFLRRHALVVAATVAVTLALISGLVASVWQARIAENERQLADHERQLADRERQRAEQRFEDVRGLAHAMIFDLHDELVKLPGSTAARSLLVKQALIYLQRLGEESDSSIPLRRELAEAWLRVGDVQGEPSMPNLGDAQGALKSYAQAAARIDSVLREQPGDKDARFLQAKILLNRAALLFDTEDLVEADADYRRDIVLWTQLVHDGVHAAGLNLAFAQSGLANMLFYDGKREQALQLYERAQATMEKAGPGDAPKEFAMFLGTDEVDRGDTLNLMGRHAESTALLRHALERFGALQRLQPDDPEVISALADASMLLGDNLAYLPDQAPRLAAYVTARDTFARLVAADPSDMHAKRRLALYEQRVGHSLVDLKRYDEGLEQLRAALRGEQQVAAHDPGDADTLQDMAHTWYGIGLLNHDRKRHDLAVAAFQQSLALQQTLLAQSPREASPRRDMARVLGDLANEQSDRQQSCGHWLASDAGWQSLSTDGGALDRDKAEIVRAHQHAAACR